VNSPARPIEVAVSISVPEPPEFGEPLPIRPSAPTLAFLARRRSASALTLRAPGPAAGEINTLLRLATRVPDHGKLSPWRFIVISGPGKAALADALLLIAKARSDATKAVAALGKFNAPPTAICVVSHTAAGEIPEWEQQLSAGAVCMSLVNAASAMGYGANWITDWYSTDPTATALIGLKDGERVAGMVYIGTAPEAPLERVRPDLEALVTRL
jgi:nitroreductase